jgi:hypothetical protein
MKTIETTKDLCEAIREGSYSSVGGYPLYFVCRDGCVLHPEHVKKNALVIARELKQNLAYSIQGIDINWYNHGLTCEESNQEIQAAYCN